MLLQNELVSIEPGQYKLFPEKNKTDKKGNVEIGPDGKPVKVGCGMIVRQTVTVTIRQYFSVKDAITTDEIIWKFNNSVGEPRLSTTDHRDRKVSLEWRHFVPIIDKYLTPVQAAELKDILIQHLGKPKEYAKAA